MAGWEKIHWGNFIEINFSRNIQKIKNMAKEFLNGVMVVNMKVFG